MLFFLVRICMQSICCINAFIFNEGRDLSTSMDQAMTCRGGGPGSISAAVEVEMFQLLV